VDEIVEDLQRRRDRYGISYVIAPGEVAEAFARWSDDWPARSKLADDGLD